MLKTRFLFFYLLIMFAAFSKAQISDKINPAILSQKWEAKWITHPDISGSETGVYLFRKSIEIESVPNEFILNISADNRFILYVNGSMVGRGPLRGDLLRWHFETIDIAPYLIKGTNNIGIKVWNMGTHTPVAQVSHKTGLIIQGNSDQEKAINSNSTWKVITDGAYSFYKISHLKKYYVAGPGEKFEGENHPWEWHSANTDNSEWLAAKEGANGTTFRAWTPTGPIPVPLLYPRSIPMLEATKQFFSAVRRSDGVDNAKNLIIKDEVVEIPANKTVKILLDQGHLTNAYPQLLYSKGANSTIKITYAESLFKTLEKDGVRELVFDKGNRDNIEDKEIWGNYDIIIPDGGDNRLFEPLWWRCFRYVELEITTGDSPLVLQGFDSEYTGYPLEQRASFSSDKEVLSEIFDVAWRTQLLCAGETFFDCPYYEQLQYTGDTRIQALVTNYVSGDTMLWRKALIDYHDSRLPFGLTQSRYPSAVAQVIPTFSLVWVTMLYDYMMYCNDQATIKKMLPAVQDILNWFDERIEDSGLQGEMQAWLFVDWVEGWKMGRPPFSDKKHSSIIGLQYVYTLQKAARLFEAMGEMEQKEKWIKKAEKTQKAIYAHCWDEERNMIADTPEKNKFSQHANVLAVLTGTFGAEKQAEIMKQIIADKSISQCSYYFTFYMVEALKKAGLGDMYLSTLAPWEELLKKGLTTFVEASEPSRSDCHAWSASPLYFYYSLLAGIEPGSPGFNDIYIAPSLGNLKELSTSMPHPKGTIKAVYNIDKKGTLTARLSIPKGTSGVFVWKAKKYLLTEGEQEFVVSD